MMVFAVRGRTYQKGCIPGGIGVDIVIGSINERHELDHHGLGHKIGSQALRAAIAVNCKLVGATYC